MRRPLAIGATVLGATLLSLAGAEGVARLLLPPLSHVEIREDPDAEGRRRAENEADQPGLYVHTPVGLRLRANKIATVSDHHFSHLTFEMRTNSIGYRNPEIGPKERRRVLFLGDSITIAGYMEEADTFVRRVEALSESDGGAPYETINAGVGGVSLADELAILTETGLALDPDVVVIGFYLNDALPSPAVVVNPPPAWMQRSRLVGHLALVIAAAREEDGAPDAGAPPDLDAWLERVRTAYPPAAGNYRTDRAAFHDLIVKNFRDWGTAWSEDAWARMEPVFREFRRLADLHGFELRIVAFPHRIQVEAEFLADEPQQRLAAVAAELDVPVLDLLPVYREAFRDGERRLFFDHCHPTPAGHGIAADAILAFLRRTEGVAP